MPISRTDPSHDPAGDAPAGGNAPPGIPPYAWRLVGLLAVANVLNFYDRALPTIVAEDIKAEFALSDTQLGVLMSGFTVVYALAGIVLGRMADRRSRRVIMAGGLVLWSVLTAASGGAWSFASLLIFRLGVGVGEASYAPAANATVFDMFPVDKRSRATAVLQLGLPVGLLLAFFTTGPLVEAFDSWRIPFYVAAIPGLVVAALLLIVPMPERPRPTAEQLEQDRGGGAIRSLLRIPTMWWLILAGIGLQISSYSVATFLVPLLQRYFGLSLSAAGVGAGLVMGVAGLVGLLIAGPIADRARRRSSVARLAVAAIGMAVAAPLAWAAFGLSPSGAVAFIVLLSLASMFINMVQPVALPAVSEIVEERRRASAVAIYFGAFYLLGGAFGPVLTGALSEYFADRATATADITASALGLHTSMAWLLPLSCLLCALGIAGAMTTIERDRRRAAQPEVSR
ncbi:spinster family MFS transporter [Nocardia sp. NPDC057668]|uniref:spinster family MFS transporter n=1 Tax=Nocardia sp. NPDC057668 TaxID=3346202 RepID=UPI003672EC94